MMMICGPSLQQQSRERNIFEPCLSAQGSPGGMLSDDQEVEEVSSVWVFELTKFSVGSVIKSIIKAIQILILCHTYVTITTKIIE